MRKTTCVLKMSLRIYFAGSIRGGRDDVQLYMKIIRLLQGYGTVLTEHVADERLGAYGEKQISDEEIHKRDFEWLSQSDVMVAEVTQPSLGVGYEIGRAVDMNKRILCLHRPQPGKRLSAMIRGIHNGSSVTVRDYEEKEIESILQTFFSSV
ncbi:2'-deoxynucleoside 5'-phosphate N-hydrolase 1 [Geodia barretti]|nr:2'-deoxynucleoside 5'-phosphate N-hydrolase 1 [Geodia barretti]